MLRGVVTGEYVVNLHYYGSETGQPVDVNVRLAKVNPKNVVAVMRHSEWRRSLCKRFHHSLLAPGRAYQ